MNQVADPAGRAAGLPCWSGQVAPEPLSGGITNVNFVVADQGQRFFVRIGEDIPVHGILRVNELAATRAAEAAGISPEVVYAEPGAIVIRFVEGRTYTPDDVRDPANLERIVALIRRCHHEMPRHLRGPVLMFWVFHVIRDYAGTLRDGKSRSLPLLPKLLERAETLEAAVGPIEVVFGHNDLLAANFIDDGHRLWLVDWDYAGFNSPLFDLANVASNNEFPPALVSRLLETYYGAHPDTALRRRYQAMACASLLRETMWSMVSEIHSTLDFDYLAYTDENLARFERSYGAFESA
ncbi:MAG: phosphotransferase [Rhodospirillales bacterium]|nr:phosphotransferase [Rhodospirillales bacterium]